MKFSMSKDRFATAINWVARSAPARPVHPILSGLRIEADADGVTLKAFDYEVSSRMTCIATVDDPGVALVSAKVLATIAASLPKAPVEVEIRDRMLVIECGSATATLPLMDADDYPSLPTLDESVGQVDADDLARAVKQTAYAVSHSEALAPLTGVLFHFRPDRLTLVGTDTYRITTTDLPFTWDWKPQEFKALVPPQMLGDFCAEAAGAVQVLFSEEPAEGLMSSMMGLANQGKESTTRLLALAGQYPKYDRVMPSVDAPIVAMVDTAELSAALKRAQGVSEKVGKVEVTIGADRIRLVSGEDSRMVEELAAKVEGEEMTVSMNLRFFSDAVANLGDPALRISARQPVPGKGSALLLTPGVDDLWHRHVIQSLRA